ncbi:hypothetical protein [uncultured Dokdonia sp.]|uniref:hypothetical protein n=1 Tax=uncultured Dokdonia sp. TaxID=575653 RepID=UPI0026019E8E|nr:hypothetical protein [uncultured Dokdonia sp.]
MSTINFYLYSKKIMSQLFKKYAPILIAILMIIYYSSDIKKSFQKVKFETKSSNGNELKIFTNWFEIQDGVHNKIQVIRTPNKISSGIVFRTYFSGNNRNERIDSVINVRWLRNDSLVILHTKLKNNQEKMDSLFWLKEF